jgi:hypothetical protein
MNTIDNQALDEAGVPFSAHADDHALLFDVPVQLSPRLEWIKRKGVNFSLDRDSNDIVATSHCEHCGHSAEGFGATEDDACLDLAEQEGWKMWHEERV